MTVTSGLATGVGVLAFVGSSALGPRIGARRPHLPPPGRRAPPLLGGTARARGWRDLFGGGRRPAARGTARWAGGGDLRPLVVASGRDTGPPPGRLVLGRAGRRSIASERAQSVIVIGPTQSHKTSGFGIPAILEWQGPVVAASVKTDLLDHTIHHRRRVGTVQCFDPSGSTGMVSSFWSPLPASRTWPGARRAAAALTEVAKSSAGTMSDGDFWYATATKMLAPLLFAAAFGKGDMADVVRWVDTHEEAEVLDLLGATGVPEAINAARSLFGKDARQRSSIYTTVETVLEPFATSGDAAASASAERVDPMALIRGSNTLYVCAPAHDQRRLTPLFAAVIRQIVECCYDQVTRIRRPLDPPLLIVLDEAANIAPLHDLDALAATAAGHGLQLVTIWHDLAQITARYGPRALTVVNNHRAKLFLSGISDPSTLDYASHLIGEEEVLLPALTHGGMDGAASTTLSPSVRKLAAPDALRRIAPGEGFLVYGHLPPARLRLRAWFDDARLRRLAQPGGSRPT